MKKNLITIAFMAMVVLFCLPGYSQITDATPQHEVEYEQDAKIKYKDFRFAVGGGYAYSVGKIEKTNNQVIDDMNKKLHHGFTVDGDAQYFFKETWGIGLNANMSSFSTSASSSFTMPDVEGTISSYNESQRTIYVGPSFVTRHETDKFLLIGSVGFGPIFFMDNASINGIEVNGTQTTLGTNISLSGEYKMSNKMGLGLKLSSTGGTINSLNFNGQNIKSKEPLSLANVTASLFLSFRSW